MRFIPAGIPPGSFFSNGHWLVGGNPHPRPQSAGLRIPVWRVPVPPGNFLSRSTSESRRNAVFGRRESRRNCGNPGEIPAGNEVSRRVSRRDSESRRDGASGPPYERLHLPKDFTLLYAYLFRNSRLTETLSLRRAPSPLSMNIVHLNVVLNP